MVIVEWPTASTTAVYQVQPIEDATAEAAAYRERSLMFLLEAQHAFIDGDMEQTSAKPWGSATLMVKAAAALRGLDHRKRRDLFKVVDSLVRESGEVRLNTLFIAANGFNSNFYEGWFTVEQVSQCLAEVADFVKRVEDLPVSHTELEEINDTQLR